MKRKVCTVVEKSEAKGMYSCGKSEAKGMYSCGKKCGERYVQLWKKVRRKVCTVVEKSEEKGMYSCGKKCGER